MTDFEKHLEEVAGKFRRVKGPVKVVSNLDADGISACTVMVRALKRERIKHSVRIIHQLREKELLELKEEDFDFYVFTDLGSGALSLIERILKEKQALVLDHHEPHGEASNVWHVNPHLFGIDGSAHISAAGVTFMFCRALNKENEDMAHIALVGAIGDVQEDDGFGGLNSEILEIAEKKGLVEVKKDLNLYGKESRPLYKLLQYSSDLHIPGVSGSESGTVQFLKSIGVEPMEGGKWRYIRDLDAGERQRLAAGIIMKRVDKKNPEDILTNSYTFPGEEGVFRNAKEFSTLLNACGRMDKAIIGVGACLGDGKYKKKALQVQTEYKREIVGALKWFEANEDSENITKEDGYIIINAKDEVKNTIIGTLISILSMGNRFPSGTVMLSMARKPDRITKVSIRVVDNPENIHLGKLIAGIAEKVGGESGGHQYAAGAIIPTDKEDEFVAAAEQVLKNIK